ncbi:alpha/beta hydrolase [Sinorhizobium sp. A49]|uniref:alpha/beta fold hydrolase n=1 Tax=Sinorhizobium sp. A49 TaxID=1945861 RepID=UPI0009857D4C|nr:alpha/beta hydrolase [Sinorhizobium sp. A49]OOG69153.1 alpha/beta hydrolase [Sinorhizobium sp. A49]
MVFRDIDLTHLERHGIPPLPEPDEQGFVETRGARIWYGSHGSGPAVILLHGGMGNSGNWGYQVPAIIDAGYRAVVVDSRGHGRSTRDARDYSYQLMAADTRSVMERLQIHKAAIIGWSDGADTGLILAQEMPERVAGIFFFACNVDNSGTRPFEFTPIIGRIWQQHQKDYAARSATPGDFDALSAAVEAMQRTQPNLPAAELAAIAVPVAVVLGEHDEFIKKEHMAYLAETLPDAALHILPGLSHFAPLQSPDVFNDAMLAFLSGVLR